MSGCQWLGWVGRCSDSVRIRGSFWGDGDVLELIVWASHDLEYTKIHWVVYFTWLNGMGCEGYLKLLPKKSQWLSWGMGISVLFPFVCPPSSVISRFPHFPDVTPHYLDNGNGSNLQKHFRGRMLTIGLLAKNGRDGKSVSPPSEKARGGSYNPAVWSLAVTGGWWTCRPLSHT